MTLRQAQGEWGGVAWAGCASVAQQAADIRRAVTVARVDQWVLAAQTGARLIYGIGHSAAEAAGEGVAARLRELCAAGLVMLVAPVRARPAGAPRDPEYGHDFLAIRTSVLVPPKFPQLPPAAVAPRGVIVTKIAGKR